MAGLQEPLPQETFPQGQGWGNPPHPRAGFVPVHEDDAAGGGQCPGPRSGPVSPRTKHPDVAGRGEAAEVDGLG